MAAALATRANPAVSAAAAVGLHPPASHFAELLRNSKFAAFDPAIRQTYESPPDYAYRGNWGLKRPISLRRKNAFITIKSGYEHHAQFIEWNNAESQVRFIRRIEEMNITPQVGGIRTPWTQQIGSALHEWVMDSDFAPAEENIVEPNTKNITQDLPGLGHRGPGQYSGARQMTYADPVRKPARAHVQPNIYAMTPAQFTRYLRKLRALRPKFYQHLQSEAVRRQPDLAGKTLFQIAQNTAANYHRTFLAAHTAAEFSDPERRRIEQQPHRTGGLMYAHPSPLDSYFTTKPEPGFVLQEKLPDGRAARFGAQSEAQLSSGAQGRQELPYIASFGGLSATLKKQNMPPDAQPLLLPDSETGVAPERVPQAIRSMRVIPGSLRLIQPPKVVGRKGHGLKAVRIESEVRVDVPHTQRSLENPFMPGTAEYITAQARATKASLNAPPSMTRSGVPRFIKQERNTARVVLLNSLQGMVGNKNANLKFPRGDSDL